MLLRLAYMGVDELALHASKTVRAFILNDGLDPI
jgi:hypothetical protein